MIYTAPDSLQPLAFSYIRMSTSSQLKGDSFRRQTELSKKYAEDNNLRLVEQLEDIGVSAFRGTNAKEGALAAFLLALDKKEIPVGSYLLIESIDRLSRQKITASMQIFLNILEAGINIVTLLDNQVFRHGETDLTSMIISLTLMSRAHEESETKSKRLSAAWNTKRENIKEEKLTQRCPGWMYLSDDRKSFILHEDKVEIIKNIFKYASEGYGTYTIYRKLNQQKIPSFGKSKLWIKSYVTKILTERAVLGEFQPHRLINGKRSAIGDPIQNYYPQIIDEDVFLKIQLDRKSRAGKVRGPRGNAVANLFKNIAVCDYCKLPMHFVNKGNGPKNGKYLKCSGAISGSGCNPAAWRYSDFEQTFFFFCNEINLNDIINASARNSEKRERELQIEQAKSKIAARMQERERIFALMQNTNVSTDYISGKLEEVSKEIDSAEIQLKMMEVNHNETIASAMNEEGTAENFFRVLDTSDLNEANKIRNLVQNKLLKMVKYLHVGGAGGGGNIKRVKDMMLSNTDSAEDQQEILDYYEQVAEVPNTNAPYFRVGFHGEIHRSVVVDPSDPKKFITHVEVTNEGKIALQDDNANWAEDLEDFL